MPYEETFRQYLEELPQRIDEEFMKATPVLEFLSGEGASVFNPRSWEGILMEPVDFEIDSDMPKEIKPYRSKIPHGLEEVYEKELERLTKYLYNPSNSSIASPVVVGKKKTHPFIRLCGDYIKVNKYLQCPSIFSCHSWWNIRFTLIVTIIRCQSQIGCQGCYHSKPHLVSSSPSSCQKGFRQLRWALMAVMRDIFKDYLAWMIVIHHNNMLILCKIYEDVVYQTSQSSSPVPGKESLPEVV
jgi:hypothetical protein